MAGTLTLRVITPERIALDMQVHSVRVPGVDGHLGILPRHAPMVAALDTGIVRFREEGREARLFVSGGFAFYWGHGTYQAPVAVPPPRPYPAPGY